MIDKLSTSGFSVLNNTEMLTIDGGWNWGAVLGGAALVVACIGDYYYRWNWFVLCTTYFRCWNNC